LAPPPEFPLGVNLRAIPVQPEAFDYLAAAGAPPPASVDNRALFGPVRNQDPRYTCVGFSSCAVLEAAAVRAGGVGPAASWTALSPQYLYWDCKDHDGEPSARGTYLGIAFELLKADGVCTEATWPYDSAPKPGQPEGDGPPPPGATAEADNHRIIDYVSIAPTSVLEVQTQLAKGFCVAVSIPVFESWYGSAEVRRTGAIVLPFPGEQPVSGHAVCLAGYRTDTARPGGGEFVLRNSWGPSWGEASPDGPGYGTLPFAFLAAYGREAYSVLD
jgi:hypothetical protein